MRKITVSVINQEIESIADILSQFIGGSTLDECTDDILRQRYYQAAHAVIEKISSWEEESIPTLDTLSDTKEEFLEAVRLGIRDAIPRLHEDQLYKVVGQAVESGVRKFLKRG